VKCESSQSVYVNLWNASAAEGYPCMVPLPSQSSPSVAINSLQAFWPVEIYSLQTSGTQGRQASYQ